MSADTLRTALDQTLDNPFDEATWEHVEEIVTDGSGDDVERQLELARIRHEELRNWSAVARLLELELGVDNDVSIISAKQLELGRIYHEELYLEDQAAAAYKAVLLVREDDATSKEVLARIESGRESVSVDVEQALVEALNSEDDGVKASQLLRAAELTFRYEPHRDVTLGKALEYVTQALKTEPENPRALSLAAAILEKLENWGELVAVLEKKTTIAGSKQERIAAAFRVATIFRTHLDGDPRAVEAHSNLLDFDPGNPIALRYLVDRFTDGEDWDHLSALYEDQLESGAVRGVEESEMWVQLALLNWRTRGLPEQAEPWFEKIRRVDPTSPAMLAFYREVCREKGDTARLMTILTDAQRAMEDGDEKTALATEIAELAENQENARRAIDQYKGILRSDPENEEARARLKALYVETESYSALVELLRQELALHKEGEVEPQLAILREIADVYRTHLQSDTALLTVLNQIVQLAPDDVESVRGLVRVYERLSRWRDLLTMQQRLAELTDSLPEKESLLRGVARTWLDKFSNVQNAMVAYEALREVAPTDVEARERLRELYQKRRAWDRLYQLFEDNLGELDGPPKVDLMLEMAKLAAERLNRGDDAIRLLKGVLKLDPSTPDVLDQLERQAERQKDFPTVAEVLERRIEMSDDDRVKLSLLQKLGSHYADKIKDPVESNSAWRRVLELSPGHKRALRVLRQAYVDA
ncbi:MAG: hypothetical protein AAGA56_17000, partial [Myxococcota bacterium]